MQEGIRRKKNKGPINDDGKEIEVKEKRNGGQINKEYRN